jgi:hypothetical protein
VVTDHVMTRRKKPGRRMPPGKANAEHSPAIRGGSEPIRGAISEDNR